MGIVKAIDIRGIGFSYPGRRVLNNLSFEVKSGEIFGLLGPNGGGKTTVFKILSTSCVPESGQVFIFDMDITKNSERVRTSIGVVFQSPSLDKKLTLKENIWHQGHLYGLRGAELNKKISDALSKFSLLDRANDMVETLSGGLQRRGEIAKGLLHTPKILLMDEPSSGLDPGARREMWDYLIELKKEGMTILLTTHLIEEAEKCDRVAIIHKGSVVAIGEPRDLTGKIGADIISIQAKNPEDLCQKIKAKWNTSPVVMSGQVRLEIREGHKFIPTLVETFPGVVEAVSLGKPTLEDVFVKETGERFKNE